MLIEYPESFMFMPLLLGCFIVFITMAIQIAAVVFMLNYLLNLLSAQGGKINGAGMNTYIISIVMLMMFVGHIVQVAIWAILFENLGEFSDFSTAFYHSMVNFASLGYGDIVMSERWRLLGAMEASNGVLMFGLSAGTLLSVMNFILSNAPISRKLDKFTKT
jgi:hypothetical protein